MTIRSLKTNAQLSLLAGFGFALSGPAISAELCETNITALSEYACNVPALSGSNEASTLYWLKDEPIGMRVQPNSGVLHWTPAAAQSGNHTVRIIRKRGDNKVVERLTFTVTNAGATAKRGIYVASDGNDADSGAIDQPLASISEAAARATAGTIIYLRGGIYRNPQFGEPDANRGTDSLHIARITTSGEPSAVIQLRPHGNEFVKLESDRGGLLFRFVRHWVLRDLEIQGPAASITEAETLAHWWKDGSDNAPWTGRGVQLQKSFAITVRDSVIHHWPGAGISNNYGSGHSILNNAIYNNAWWSTAGTHGVSNSKMQDDPEADTPSKSVQKLHGNLVFGNQSSVISHVFSKGFTTLEIDEGNGLHLQNNAGLYTGNYSVRDNLLLYNGKAGLGLNTIDRGVIVDNVFYQNAQAVNTGELAVQTSTPNKLTRNLFTPLAERRTIKNSDSNTSYHGQNATTAASDAADLPSSMTQRSQVVRDASSLDFRPVAELPQRYGISAATQAKLDRLIQIYALQPAPAPSQVDDDYVQRQKQILMDSWPHPDSHPSIDHSFELHDKDSGYRYRYDTRHCFPAAPTLDC